MTYKPKTQAERWFAFTVYASRRGNKRRKRQMQCGYGDHYQCKHVDERQQILSAIHKDEMKGWWCP